MRYCREEELLEITCSDTGKGISVEHLDKVFNPFYTTRHEAVGLGLFVTKKLVDNMGGNITASSRIGGGTTFTVTLPIRN